MLVANSYLTGFVLGIETLSMGVFTLQNDLKQIEYQDSLCIIRGYLSYSLCAVENYSFLAEALYRYMMVVYPNYLFWQSARIQLLFLCSTWIFALIFPIPFIFTGGIIYNVDNQICQLPFQLSISLVFAATSVFALPMSMTIFIYLRLVQYVKEMSRRVVLTNSLSRAKRELKMVRRLVILVIIIFAVASPYALFVLISFFTAPPKYHFRIGYIFINLSVASVMMALLQFTDPLKASIKKIIYGRLNTVTPTMT
ncbi:unnamed protein product [Adineta steineri]|uniref:G-protein coupled receptors family 1 profile domain-containing protein n=1 Tax=Adineta steineri TaxID=433720 RepID=A0A814FDE9_9BILA|nr:unnamed protein product [Adineta steineri]CAF1196043.1 unnamed protein product [Adineta steineri]